MSTTYRAIEVLRPREFSEVRKPLLDPDPNQVRIRVEACGVCHSDAGTVEGLFPIDWPRVPGHEVVGRIDALGSGVQGWTVGQRVGVGFLGGSCGYCEFCRNGDLVNCQNQEYTGIHHDGGYAEVMIAKASGLVSIPDDLSSAGAAPLLCAGITTFNALRNAPARAGDLSLCSVSAALVIWLCNTPGAWGSRWRRLPVAETQRISPRSSALIITLTVPLPIPPRLCRRSRCQGHSHNSFRRQGSRRHIQGPSSRRCIDRPSASDRSRSRSRAWI
jgi:hypothetical protein